MNAPTSEQIAEFRRKLRDLVLEYDVTLEVDTGYYGDVEGVDFDDNGTRPLEDIRRDQANGSDQPRPRE